MPRSGSLRLSVYRKDITVFLHGKMLLTEVIGELYAALVSTSETNTRMCLMFIDAAHQYEALLDVLLILGHVDIALLSSGCDELRSELS